MTSKKMLDSLAVYDVMILLFNIAHLIHVPLFSIRSLPCLISVLVFLFI